MKRYQIILKYASDVNCECENQRKNVNANSGCYWEAGL